MGHSSKYFTEQRSILGVFLENRMHFSVATQYFLICFLCQNYNGGASDLWLLSLEIIRFGSR